MKAVSLAGLALLALGSAAADTVYLPIVAVPGGATEVHLANGGAEEVPVTARFLAAEGAAAPSLQPSIRSLHDAVPADSALVLPDLAPEGASGLLAVEAGPGVTAAGWLASLADDGGRRFARVPTVSERTALPAGGLASLAGLARDGGSARVGLVNVGTGTARCTVAAGGSTAEVEVPARSLRLVAAASDTAEPAAPADITCDQPFSAFGLVSGGGAGVSVVAPDGPLGVPGAAGVSGMVPAPAAAAPGAIVYEAMGLLHTASRQDEKERILVPVHRRLALKKMVVDFDVVPGPWHPTSPNGNHALIWVYRGRFRSNTIANVNAFGPGKDFVKMNQNVDLPARKVTNAKAPLKLQQDAAYHVRYVYDAASRRATTVVSQDGAVVATMSMEGTAKHRTLEVPTAGLIAEFGHYSGQHGPEVPSWGWSYLNLRIEMIPR